MFSPATANPAAPTITPFIAQRMPQSPNPYQPLLHRRQFFGDCVLACGVLENLDKCKGTTDSPEYKSCECSVFNAAGPVKVDICAECFAYFVPAGAALIVAAGKECAVGAGAVTTALSACSSQCGPIVSEFGTCSSTQCLCPSVSANGGECSACLGPINSADAAFVGSLMSECGVTFAGSGASASPLTASPVTSPTSPLNTGSVATTTGSNGVNSAGASSSATIASHSGGQGGMNGGVFGTSYFSMFMYFTIFVGLVGVFI